jgi:Cu2+-exporting ATPase
VVFQGQSLAPVAELLATARQARRLIQQNLGFAAIYNLAAIPLAVLGIITPLIAAVLMSSSSIIVVLNSLRLIRRRAEIV